MSGNLSRLAVVKRSGVALAGVRTKDITINGAPIDITSDDDQGVQKLMDAPGVVAVTIKVAGVLLNESLRAAAIATSGRIAQTEFIYAGFEGSPANTHGWRGDFYMTNYSEKGAHDGVFTFECEFQSTGPVTYTAK